MVRNIANLVPPCQLDQAQHGISAALEYGVTALGVEHIVVFGHVDCGGIRALLTSDPVIDEQHSFIHRWLQIADEARRRTLLIARDRPLEDQLRTLEQEAIKTSLANLLTFPWIEERMADRSAAPPWLELRHQAGRDTRVRAGAKRVRAAHPGARGAPAGWLKRRMPVVSEPAA